MLRAKAGLPKLFDEDDLPDPAYDPNYVHVLNDKEQKFLHRRSAFLLLLLRYPLTSNFLEQVKFQRHQTWYRAHGTETHRVNMLLLLYRLPHLNCALGVPHQVRTLMRYDKCGSNLNTLVPPC